LQDSEIIGAISSTQNKTSRRSVTSKTANPVAPNEIK